MSLVAIRRGQISLVVLAVFFGAPLFAQLPFPRLDRLAPLGMAAGTSLEFELQGADLEEPKGLVFDHPGLSAEPVPMKERVFKITAAPDVPTGTYDVRIVGRFGVSNPRLLAVSRGLTDVAEKEPNNDAGAAQTVPLNSAINGTSDGNDQDLYRIVLRKGQRVTIDCQAQRLDVPMDATLALLSATGSQLAANGDYFGRDPLIDFVAPADGEYLVTVNDLSFRGGFPYRLVVSDRPLVENVFPRALRAGETVELTVLGRNLGGAAKPSTASIFGLPLDETRLSITAPADGDDRSLFRFLEHPTAHSVQPTAATCTVNGWQVRPPWEHESLSAVPVMLVDTPVSLEREPNDQQEQPQALELPAVVSGRFDQPRDADWYQFDATEDGNCGIEVYCERIAGQADPYVSLVDDAGNRVQELDDYGHRINAFDGHLRDPSGSFNLTGKKKYRLLVQDRYRRGGPRFQYVLHLRRPVPDFFVAAMHRENPSPAGLNLWRGGATSVDLVIHQRDGYNEPIIVTAEGLPPGVHAMPTSIPQNTQGSIVLWADENAAEFTGPIRLVATGKRGDEVLRREVRPHTRVSNDGGSSRPVRQLVLAVRERAPFALKFEPNKLQVEAGKKTQVKLQLTRFWPAFTGNLTTLPMAFPGNIRMNNQEFAPGALEISFEIDIQAGTRPGDFTLAVLGQAQIAFAKDPATKDRPNVLVSQPSEPITITVLKPS